MGVMSDAQEHAREVDSLLMEAQHIYAAAITPDTERVESINKKQRDLIEAQQNRQRILKEAVIALTKDVQEAKENRTESLPDATHDGAVASVENDIFAVGKQIKHAEKTAEETKILLEQTKDEIKVIHDEVERTKVEKEVDVPRARYKLNLYENITQIRWDYNLDDSSVKGWVGQPEQKDVQPFSIDATQRSTYFISNYLWNIL